jgi:hypothetical protein
MTLTVISLALRLAVAAMITRPGYMDAAYYAAGAVRIGQGGGLSEPFIWNYLNDPAGVPHPGFLYWMPLPSLVGSPFAALLSGSFLALQVPFAVLSAFIPPVAYGLAWQGTKNRQLAWTAGLLVLFSGFFFPYWTLPETFAPFALFGSLALWLAGWQSSARRRRRACASRSLLAGLLVGLAHLTRADGVLLLPVVALAPLASSRMASIGNRSDSSDVPNTLRSRQNTRKAVALHLVMVTVGYTLVMGPWFARNMITLGTPLSPASTKTIWLTDYDDLFCYDCDLSLSSYLAWGWDNILRSKLSALWINFQRFLAEDCLIFLLPFAVMGLYRLRRRLSFLLASLYLVVIYLAHSLIFTFPGWRGGFFHASSAALPFLYAASVEGLDAAVQWASRQRRRWRYQQARSVFAAAAVVAAMVFSSYVAWLKIPAWRKTNALYKEVDRWLTNQGAPGVRVMVGDPPAFWYETRRQAIVVPSSDVETLLEAADRYEIRYVLLEEDHPAQLAELHAGAVRHPRLWIVKTWSDGDDILYAVQERDSAPSEAIGRFGQGGYRPLLDRWLALRTHIRPSLSHFDALDRCAAASAALPLPTVDQ